MNNSDIAKAYLGQATVSKIFLGTVKVYPLIQTVLHYSTSDHNVLKVLSKYADLIESNTYDTANDLGTVVFKDDVKTLAFYWSVPDSQKITYYEIPATITTLAGNAFNDIFDDAVIVAYPETCPAMSGYPFTQYSHYSFSGFTYPSESNYLGMWYSLNEGIPSKYGSENNSEYLGQCPQVILAGNNCIVNTSESDWGAKYLGYTDMVDSDYFEYSILSFDKQLTKVPQFAFNNYKNSTSIFLPSTVKSIEQYAFANSSVFAAGMRNVETIGSHAFDTCTINGVLQIPAGIKTIGAGAFNNASGYYSSKLDIQFYGAAPTIDDTAFNNIPTGSTLYVPSDYQSQYQTLINKLKNTYKCTINTRAAVPDEAFPLSEGGYFEGSAGDTITFSGTCGDGDAADLFYIFFNGQTLWRLEQSGSSDVPVNFTYTFAEDYKGYMTVTSNCTYSIDSIVTSGCRMLGTSGNMNGYMTSDTYFKTISESDYAKPTNDWVWI